MRQSMTVELQAPPVPRFAGLEIDIRLRAQVHVTAFTAQRKVSKARFSSINVSWMRSLNVPMRWLDVPYLPQSEPGGCLVACAAMVLAYLNRSIAFQKFGKVSFD
ncbi:MAG: hypothetical protein FJ014_16730 [Chloroflexi bacterium]|nr:hypothetical protein [Chloroflexota bacterium]